MKTLFISMLSLFGLLTLTSSNNLYDTPVEIMSNDSVLTRDVIRYINNELAYPLTDCYFGEENRMTKCPNQFESTITHIGGADASSLLDKKYIPVNQIISGTLTSHYCHQNGEHVASFTLEWDKNKKLLVKEGFRSKRKTAKKYVKEFCKDKEKATPPSHKKMEEMPKKKEETPKRRKTNSSGY